MTLIDLFVCVCVREKQFISFVIVGVFVFILLFLFLAVVIRLTCAEDEQELKFFYGIYNIFFPFILIFFL